MFYFTIGTWCPALISRACSRGPSVNINGPCCQHLMLRRMQQMSQCGENDVLRRSFSGCCWGNMQLNSNDARRCPFFAGAAYEPSYGATPFVSLKYILYKYCTAAWINYLFMTAAIEYSKLFRIFNGDVYLFYHISRMSIFLGTLTVTGVTGMVVLLKSPVQYLCFFNGHGHGQG
jgi:hypothetical protein